MQARRSCLTGSFPLVPVRARNRIGSGVYLCLPLAAAAGVGSLLGRDVGVRYLTSGKEIVQELLARDRAGNWHTILVSPTHERTGGTPLPSEPALKTPSSGLFQALPTFGFQRAKVDASHGTVEFVAESDHATIRETVTVPRAGKTLSVSVVARMKDRYPRIDHFLASYAFYPGSPDTTWTPALRLRDDGVIGDHFFRAPAVIAQKGPLSASLMPDLVVLAQNRPIPTIIDLDCKSRSTLLPLLSYGFADYKLVSHVSFAHDSSMTRAVPRELRLGFQIRLDAESPRHAAYQAVASDLWERYGHGYLERLLPQAMPFADYARVCYPAAFGERMTGGWFERTTAGHLCGGLPSGWGLDQGWVSWQDWFNQIRSAWGMRWWGKKLGQAEWVIKSGRMLNLALAAPMNHGACPTTYDSRKDEWRGSLITPRGDCYYDLTNIAWKGIWLLRWLDFPDCPRRDDIVQQLGDMEDLLIRYQEPDGAFPTWLDRNLKVVPILDRSAQSALPTWFLADIALSRRVQADPRARLSAIRGATFLARNVVDQQRYYDFETFFSCSPKQCLQMERKLDDPAMWDPHTLQRPQNTLSMQWCAEALRAASKLDGNEGFMGSAMKALDIMTLYQNVWPMSYRRVAYNYGGFGVQNSDGEYDDARQSQFAETLCDFGVETGRRDLFERGVAAARASLALINHPLHERLGIYPDPNYPLGLEPENDGHGGSDEQDGRSGFDWAEGSGLAGIAALLDKYGSTYHDKNGWAVPIDGVAPGTVPAPRDPAPTVLLDPTFDFSDWRMPGWTFEGDFLHWPTDSARMDFGNQGRPFIGTCEDGNGAYDDAYTGTITSPPFRTTKAQMKLLVGGGPGAGEYVELIDETGKQLYVEHGRKVEHMDERTWDMTSLRGKTLRIRIVDRETGDWGHINVGWIRLTG